MKIFTTVSRYFLMLLLIGGAFGHFLNPESTNGFIPDFMPKQAVQIATGIVELVLAILLRTKKYRHKAASFTLILMIAFLPIHILDFFKEQPVIGSKNMAIIRIPVQFIFMYLSWLVMKSPKGELL